MPTPPTVPPKIAKYPNQLTTVLTGRTGSHQGVSHYLSRVGGEAFIRQPPTPSPMQKISTAQLTSFRSASSSCIDVTSIVSAMLAVQPKTGSTRKKSLRMGNHQRSASSSCLLCSQWRIKGSTNRAIAQGGKFSKMRKRPKTGKKLEKKIEKENEEVNCEKGQRMAEN